MFPASKASCRRARLSRSVPSARARSTADQVRSAVSSMSETSCPAQARRPSEPSKRSALHLPSFTRGTPMKLAIPTALHASHSRE